MWNRLRKALVWIAAMQAIAWVLGQIIARRLSKGDEQSDEFQLVSICGGKKFRSRAGGLRSGSVLAAMGGVELDLRGAQLDPAGATIDVDATMGGVQIVVPDDWLVVVDTSGFAGGAEAKVTDPAELPDNAPKLRVHAAARMGGTQVVSDSRR